MGDLRPFKRPTHQCYNRTRRWGGGVVKDKVCPLCEEHRRKKHMHLVASRLRGRIKRRGFVSD